MGRITVFTADDLLSCQTKAVLEKKSLPYTEISFLQCPSNYDNVGLLSSCTSVPQVFFNTRFVGGLDGTLKELKKWEKKCGSSTFSIQKKYHEDIGKHPPVINESFEPIPRDKTPSDTKHTPYCISAAKSVELQDGTKTTNYNLIEKLKNSLPFIEEYKHKGNVYINCCFTGKFAVEEFQNCLCQSEEDAIAFGSLLLKQNVIYRVDNASTETIFGNIDKSVYSLYCLKTPQILNSYCEWSTPITHTASEIIEELDVLLRDIELASINEDGKLDHSAVRHNKSYPMFEQAVCILQKVNLIGLDYNEMLAFALNLYTLMIRYAFIKVGVPTDDSSRLKLLSKIQFNIGGQLFTFSDWVDGVLRGNRNTRFIKKKPFQENDARKKLSVFKTAFDVRIHFAINTGPWFGTRSCLPFERYTAENIEKQLDIVSNVYFEDDVNFQLDRHANIYLTKPIAWYRCDFCDKDSELKVVIQKYVQGAKLLELRKIIRENPKLKAQYVDLDRTINAINYLEFDDECTKKGKGVKGLFFRRSIQRFRPPKMHPNEVARLTALHDLNVLDSLPEERMDRLTLMVREKFDVPIVLVSLVDENRQWFLSKQWFCSVPEANETPRDISFCGHAILGSGIFLIKDATKDERFADNPLVTGDLNLRFYAGCPLSVPDTSNADSSSPTTANIGTLCLIDQKPRDFSDEDSVLLGKYAAEVRDEILLRQKEQNPISALARFNVA